MNERCFCFFAQFICVLKTVQIIYNLQFFTSLKNIIADFLKTLRKCNVNQPLAKTESLIVNLSEIRIESNFSQVFATSESVFANMDEINRKN